MYDDKNQNSGIDLDYIEKSLRTKCFGKKVVYYDEIDSTNALAKKLGKQSDTHGMLVIAEQQNAGRGRLGRNWSSPSGCGIWMTLILKPHIHPGHAAMLTLVAALAVNKGIRQLGLNSLIKWPNDIVVNGKKVCGILTEMNTSNEMLECVVVGMGINANIEFFSKELETTASSLQLESGKKIDRDVLIVDIMKYFEQYYEVFMRTETLKDLVHEYNQVLVNANHEVKIIERDLVFEGIALGIDETGVLLVKTQELEEGTLINKVKAVVAGEVSVRGIYGYV